VDLIQSNGILKSFVQGEPRFKYFAFLKILEILFHSTDDVSSAHPTRGDKVSFCHENGEKFIISLRDVHGFIQ
jgi:hypothetical protein